MKTIRVKAKVFENINTKQWMLCLRKKDFPKNFKKPKEVLVTVKY